MAEGLKRVFSEISNGYERLNGFFTFGFDQRWRKKAVRFILSIESGKCLDVCTGTGELAVMISKLSGGKITVFASDFSEDMMEIAKRKTDSEEINYVYANSDDLPFYDNYFDSIIAGFAGRNLNSSRENLVNSFKELYRVLKPGGRFINLETSQPALKPVKFLFHFYIKNVVRPLGQILSGSKGAYNYLSYSILKFYKAEELLQIFIEAGYTRVSYKKLLFGIAAIHTGVKTGE